MNYKNLFLNKLLIAGVITGVYIFDFRRAWADEVVVTEPVAVSVVAVAE